LSVPEKVDSVLASYLSDRNYYSVFKEYNVITHWKEIVGDDIASVSRCVSVENNILYVAFQSSSWRQEMSFLKKDILKKIREITNCSSIQDIVFI
jgi:predicted nucleic acid-binding Zn ribbon protein